jgi:hypothetical protein
VGVARDVGHGHRGDRVAASREVWILRLQALVKGTCYQAGKMESEFTPQRNSLDAKSALTQTDKT